jgi:hypothetical protein
MGFESLNEGQFVKENRIAVPNRVVSFNSNDKLTPSPQLNSDGTYPSQKQEIVIAGGGYPVPTVWTPSQIDTLVWYDASDLSTITESGGKISHIDDKSGNEAFLVQDSDSNQPTIGREINGVDAINFDYGQWMECSSNFATRADGEMMVFCVADPDDRARGTFDDALFSIIKANDVFLSIIPYSETEFNGLLVFRSSEGLYGDPYENAPHNGPSIYGWTKQPVGGFVNYVDGTDVYPNQGLDLWEEQSLDTIWIARSRYNSTYMDMGFGEFIVTDNVSTEIRQKIEGYLAWKWGIASNLPSDHPYKGGRPYYLEEV